MNDTDILEDIRKAVCGERKYVDDEIEDNIRNALGDDDIITKCDDVPPWIDDVEI